MNQHLTNTVYTAQQENQTSQIPPVVWSIAGSDSGAGAGIQADLRAFQAFGVHGCSAVAALTAQNSVAVEHIEAVSAEMLDAQLAALASDMPPVAIKTGMLASVENIAVVVKWIDQLRTQYPQRNIALIVDPIHRASSGAEFSSEQMRQLIVRDILPRTTLLKPNITEAYWLVTGKDVPSDLRRISEVPRLAETLKSWGATSVVITGGDVAAQTISAAADWMDTPQACGWLELPLISQPFTHGTGCTFTASATAALALGFCEADAIILAKMATADAIRNGHSAGAGHGVATITHNFAKQSDLLPLLKKEYGEPTHGPFTPLSQEWMGLYPVLDDVRWIDLALQAGAKTLQLRIKSNSLESDAANTLSEQVKQCVQLTHNTDVQFFVNDYWQLAIEHGAYGVHLGQEDLYNADLDAICQAGLRFGVSTQSLWELCRAKAIRPSYIACGPIYTTKTKDMPWLPQGAHNLAYWSHLVQEPIVAIGGIDLARCEEVVRAGAKGVAVVSAVTHAKNSAQAIAALQQAIDQGRHLAPFSLPRLPHTTLLSNYCQAP